MKRRVEKRNRTTQRAPQKPSKKPSKKPNKKPSKKANRKLEMDLLAMAGWIECAPSVADAMRERCQHTFDGLAPDIRFATLARDVWREHPGQATELVSLLDRYLEQTQVLSEIAAQLTPLADVPEDQHVHLPDGTVGVERIRTANVISAKA